MQEAKQTQETFLPDEAKGQMTVKSFKTCVCRLLLVMLLIKEIIKAIMLSNFDAHKASDLADNQIALCAAMITRSDKGLTSCNTQNYPHHQVQDGCLALAQLKPSNRSHLLPHHML